MADIILFGLGRFGENLLQNLHQRGFKVLGVDLNSRVVAEWNRKGVRAIYGDAEDPEFISTLPIQKAQWIVSTIPQRDINLTLLDTLHHHGYEGQRAVTTHNDQDIEILRESGADLILFPFADAAKEAAELLWVEKGGLEVKQRLKG